MPGAGFEPGSTVHISCWRVYAFHILHMKLTS